MLWRCHVACWSLSLSMMFACVLIPSVESLVQDHLILLHPILYRPQWFVIQSVEAPSSFCSTRNQSHVAQHTQVF